MSLVAVDDDCGISVANHALIKRFDSEIFRTRNCVLSLQGELS